MENLKMLKEELITLDKIYLKNLDDFDKKYKDEDEVDNDEDYVAIIAAQAAHTTLSAVIERIDQITNMKN